MYQPAITAELARVRQAELIAQANRFRLAAKVDRRRRPRLRDLRPRVTHPRHPAPVDGTHDRIGPIAMDLDRILAVAGLLVGITSPAAVVLAWVAAKHPARRLLRLHRTHPIEVIASTNAIRQAIHGEARTQLTAVGELRATTIAARTILRHYPHKKISVYLSTEYHGRPQTDLLLLGGPLRNAYTARLLDRLNHQYPTAQLVLDAPNRVIGVGGYQITFDQQVSGGIPRQDLALLVLATDTWRSDTRQRIILCCGLSTYGTEGATRYMFQHVLGPTPEARRLRRLLSGDAAAALIHVTIEQGTTLHAELYQHTHWTAPSRTANQRAIKPSPSTHGHYRATL